MYYSNSTQGFYNLELHGNKMPSDVVEIPHESYLSLLHGQSTGKVITSDTNGYPTLQDPLPPTPEQLANSAQAEMKAELDWADIEIKKHQEGHTRTVATPEELYAYKNACRDYVRNIDGVLTIVGDKPVRPVEGV